MFMLLKFIQRLPEPAMFVMNKYEDSFQLWPLGGQILTLGHYAVTNNEYKILLVSSLLLPLPYPSFK